MVKKSEQKSVANKALTKQEEEKLIREYRIKENINHVRIFLDIVVVIICILSYLDIVSLWYGVLLFLINIGIRYYFKKKN